MTTLQKIKDRCRIDADTGCWIWAGALSAGKYPRIWAPDHTAGGQLKAQNGIRAVWHVVTGKAIAPGHRVYHQQCTQNACVCPAHINCGPTASWGAQVARHGNWKGQSTRIQANRAIGRKRSHVTPELVREILHSDETGLQLAARLDIGPTLISRVRRGTMKSVQSVSNPFAGLMR